MKKYLVIILLVLVPLISFSQVGIGTSNPNSNSILELQAADRALLLPRVANTAAIPSPTNGMVIYDIASNCIKSYENGAWTACWSSESKNPTASVAVDCNNSGFQGTMYSGIAITDGFYKVTIVNNTFSAVTIPLAASDLVLSGNTAGSPSVTVGIISTTAGGASITSITIPSLATQTLFYKINGNPTASGTLNAVWTKQVLSCQNATLINTPITLNCAGASNNGTLYNATLASSVSSDIPYTGGTGTAYSAQEVTSTGVTGLTARLSAGNFAVGSGNLNYVITGTPNTTGVATFAISIGGRSCSFTRNVLSQIGTITSLDCAGATNNGTLTSGLAASSVSSVISYAGGNGGSHTGQSVVSTGVTGLTAILNAGTFSSSTGTLTYNITGTPSGIGTATFAINIGGQSCNLTRNVAAPTPVNPTGTGSFSGKTCFDIALGNDNINSCLPLSARTPTQSNFTLPATHTQSYTFTPIGTVSNVRFVYVNTNGSVITAINGDNTGNNISTPVVATVNFNTSLNTLAAGLTNSNPLTADIYVIYNDGATNNGTDRQLKITPNVKDCGCCVVKISATEWKEFLCHNLGADTTLDPHVPVVGLQGAYIQWGRRGPNTTGDSRVDWQTAANTSNFAAAPTAGNSNSAAIAGWSTAAASNLSWRTAGGTKTSNDPCPAGFRVPTSAEWTGVNTNNTASRTGTWTDSATNYSVAVHFGPNASTKQLTLPAAGERTNTNGTLANRGRLGRYWSSTENGTDAYNVRIDSGSVISTFFNNRTFGYSIRCIAE